MSQNCKFSEENMGEHVYDLISAVFIKYDRKSRSNKTEIRQLVKNHAKLKTFCLCQSSQELKMERQLEE